MLAFFKKNHSLILWGFLFIAGIFLLFLGITSEGIWYDESYTAAVINHSIINIIKFTANDNHPPLYYILLKIFSLIFGNSLFALRAFSALAIISLAGLGAEPIRKSFGNKAGMIFSFLVFFLPINHSMAHDIRMYTWTCFFVTATAVFAYNSILGNNKIDWFLFGLFSLAAAYSHYYGLLAITGLYFFVFLWVIIKDRGKILNFLKIVLLFMFLYFPWIFILIAQTSRVSKDFWLWPVSWYSVWVALKFPFSNKFSEGSSELLVLWGFLYICFFVFYGIFSGLIKKQHDVKISILALLGYLFTFLGGVILSYIIRPLFLDRYVFTVIGLLTLSMAYGINQVKNKILIFISLWLFLIFAVPEIIHIQKIKFNGPMHEVYTFLKDKIKKEDIFLHNDEHPLGTFYYYFPENKHFLYLKPGFKGYSNYDVFLPQGEVGSDYSEFLKENSNVWLINRLRVPYYISRTKILDKGFKQIKNTSKTFVLPNSWYGLHLMKYSKGEKKIIKRGVGTIKIKTTGFRNNSGTACLVLRNLEEFELFNGRVPKTVEKRMFDKYILNNKTLPNTDKSFLSNYYQINKENTHYNRKAGLIKTDFYNIWHTFQKINRKTLPIKNNEALFVFENLPFADYVATVIHDENNNEKLDYGNWHPEEGVGITNSLGKPKGDPYFEVHNITLDSNILEVEVPLYYFYE